MNLLSLVEKVTKALETGAVTDDSSFVALFRNEDKPIEAADAFDIRPVVGLTAAEIDIDVLVGDEGATSMTVGELREWIRENISSTPEYHLYIPGAALGAGEAQPDMPVIATASNPELSVFGVIAYFEKYETYFMPPRDDA